MYFTWLEEIHLCVLFLPRFHVSEYNHHIPANEGMISVDGAIGMVILAQAGIGTVGNVSLLCHCICSLFKRHELRPIDQIINHLALANTLTLICGGIPPTLAAFEMKYFLSDIGCKLVFYFHRVAWGTSLSITCLLGGFQALSINPPNSKWAELKFRSQKYITTPCILSWMFHLLVNVIVPMRMTGQKNGRNVSVKSNLGHCSCLSINTITESICSVIFSSVDVVCLGFMIWVSGSMILFLHRHRQQVQYIHSTRQPSPTSPGTRATKSIMLLVSAFVIFYSLSSAFEMYAYLFGNPQLWLVNTSVLLASSFPTLSPFLLLKSNTHVSSLCSSCWGSCRTYSVADSIILFSFIHLLSHSMKYLLCIIHVLDTVVGCCCCCCVTSVVSDSVRPHRRQSTRLLCPWDSPSKNTGVGCHFLLHNSGQQGFMLQ